MRLLRLQALLERPSRFHERVANAVTFQTCYCTPSDSNPLGNGKDARRWVRIRVAYDPETVPHPSNRQAIYFWRSTKQSSYFWRGTKLFLWHQPSKLLGDKWKVTSVETTTKHEQA